MSGGSLLTTDLVGSFAMALGEAEPTEDGLARAAVEPCCRLLMARQCSVWLLGPRGDELVLRAASGFEALDPSAIGRLSYPLKRPEGEPLGITPWVFVKQQPVIADTYQELSRHEAYRGEFERQLHGAGRDVRAAAHPRQQFCGVPISLGVLRLGVLRVENKTVLDEEKLRRFTPADQATLQTLATLLAVALRQAQARRQEEERRGRVHESVAESVRGETTELARAEALLAAFAHDSEPPDQRVADALRLLRIGVTSLDFWLDNLQRLVAATIEFDALPTLDVELLATQEILRFRQVAGHRLEAHVESGPPPGGVLRVRGDALYLTAALRDALRNAYREVLRWQDRRARQDQEVGLGRVTVQCSLHEGTEQLPGPHVCITVADDGEASRHEGARERLLRAWELAQSGDSAGDPRYAGLTFASWVAREHHGYVALHVGEGRALFEMHLPLAPPDDHVKEDTDG